MFKKFKNKIKKISVKTLVNHEQIFSALNFLEMFSKFLAKRLQKFRKNFKNKSNKKSTNRNKKTNIPWARWALVPASVVAWLRRRALKHPGPFLVGSILGMCFEIWLGGAAVRLRSDGVGVRTTWGCDEAASLPSFSWGYHPLEDLSSFGPLRQDIIRV